MVSQLHIHHIVRYKSDIAWPKPVWGAFPAQSYTESELTQRVNCIVQGLKTLKLEFVPK